MIVKLDFLVMQMDVLQHAASVVRRGGLIVFPTDTVYGMGCVYGNTSSLEKIYSLKKRMKDKPLPVLVSSLEEVNVLDGEISPLGQMLMRHFWPGPLTIIVNTKRKETLGIRMPNHAIALALLRLTGPLSTTSANLSTQQSPSRFAEIPKELLEQVEIAIDGGDCPLAVESTVIDTSQQRTVFLREGYLKRADVEKIIGKENVQ